MFSLQGTNPHPGYVSSQEGKFCFYLKLLSCFFVNCFFAQLVIMNLGILNPEDSLWIYCRWWFEQMMVLMVFIYQKTTLKIDILTILHYGIHTTHHLFFPLDDLVLLSDRPSCLRKILLESDAESSLKWRDV